MHSSAARLGAWTCPFWFGTDCHHSLLFALFLASDVGTAIGDTEGSGARGFYASTVAGRILIFIAFCYLVSQKFVQQQLILLAALNLVSAVGMYYALQQ